MRSRTWFAPFGAAMIAVAAVLPFTRHPPTVALIASAAAAAATGIAYLLWQDAPRGLPSVLYGCCLASFVVLYAVSGDAALGFFVVASAAVLREPRQAHLALLVAATVVLNVVQLSTKSETPLTLLATDAGILFFAAIGWLLVSERAQRERADALVQQLDESRRREQESAVAAERLRLARDLHDLLAHSLSGLTIQLEAARALSAGAPEPLRQTIATAQRLARAGLREAREAVGALRGESVAAGSVSELVEEHRLATSAQTAYAVMGEPRLLSAERAVVLYRIVQESLANVRKHAPGAVADVRVVWGRDSVVVEIDNAAPEPPDGGGWGVTGMRERAHQVTAAFDAEWRDATFRVRLDLPYSD